LNDTLARTLLTVAFGALAGGVTNSIAVWMLFHPYEPPRLWRWRIGMLQGAIPKNKGRLASSIGRTVGQKLLTAEDLSRTLAEPAFRNAFDERLGRFIGETLDARRGSLVEIMPPSLLPELKQLAAEIEAALLARLDSYLAGPAFEEAVRRWIGELADELRDKPLSDIITPEREAALTDAAERWISELVESDGFERSLRASIDRGAERLLQPGRTFQDLLPVGLIAALERAIAGYLPVALERLGGLLDDPGARARVERILHELLDRFMRDLKFHQRLVAALLITPETVNRVIRAIEAEGATKMAELLHDPSVRDAMARGVNDAIVEFLRKDVVGVLGRHDDPAVDEAKGTLTDWALRIARGPQTRSFLIERLRGMLDSIERRTWNDVFEHVPPDRVADAIIAAARSERAGIAYADLTTKLVDRLMHRPIGRPADHLAADAPRRIEGAVAGPIWRWLQDQVPAIVQRLDIATRVEQKISEFPTYQVELIIRGVIESELKLIVKLGYVLGAMIGFGSAMLALLF
jgi:uncharacterized membrane-anchored protein YjiN (DUF445 family)